MSTYKQIIYQIIFGTKKHMLTINDEHCEELYKYIWGIIKNKNCKLFRINGVENHIHILSDLHPSLGLADYVKDIKVAGSIWLKESVKFPKFDGWQDGYAAFTYSIKEKDILIEYIKNQKQHHKSESFRDEYVRLLRENGVDFDEKYLM